MAAAYPIFTSESVLTTVTFLATRIPFGRVNTPSAGRRPAGQHRSLFNSSLQIWASSPAFHFEPSRGSTGSAEQSCLSGSLGTSVSERCPVSKGTYNSDLVVITKNAPRALIPRITLMRRRTQSRL